MRAWDSVRADSRRRLDSPSPNVARTLAPSPKLRTSLPHTHTTPALCTTRSRPFRVQSSFDQAGPRWPTQAGGAARPSESSSIERAHTSQSHSSRPSAPAHCCLLTRLLAVHFRCRGFNRSRRRRRSRLGTCRVLFVCVAFPRCGRAAASQPRIRQSGHRTSAQRQPTPPAASTRPAAARPSNDAAAPC
jgi:hypothetical protein